MSTTRFVANSVRVDGVALASPRGDRHPLIRVTLLNGQTLIRELGGFSNYPPGSPAAVLYDPRDPADMQVDRTMDLWALPAMALTIGSCVLTAGLALLRES